MIWVELFYQCALHWFISEKTSLGSAPYKPEQWHLTQYCCVTKNRYSFNVTCTLYCRIYLDADQIVDLRKWDFRKTEKIKWAIFDCECCISRNFQRQCQCLPHYVWSTHACKFYPILRSPTQSTSSGLSKSNISFTKNTSYYTAQAWNDTNNRQPVNPRSCNFRYSSTSLPTSPQLICQFLFVTCSSHQPPEGIDIMKG